MHMNTVTYTHMVHMATQGSLMKSFFPTTWNGEHVPHPHSAMWLTSQERFHFTQPVPTFSSLLLSSPLYSQFIHRMFFSPLP